MYCTFEKGTFYNDTKNKKSHIPNLSLLCWNPWEHLCTSSLQRKYKSLENRRFSPLFIAFHIKKRSLACGLNWCHFDVQYFLFYFYFPVLFSKGIKTDITTDGWNQCGRRLQRDLLRWKGLILSLQSLIKFSKDCLVKHARCWFKPQKTNYMMHWGLQLKFANLPGRCRWPRDITKWLSPKNASFEQAFWDWGSRRNQLNWKHGTLKYCRQMWFLAEGKVSKSVRWRPAWQVVVDRQMTFLWGCICAALALKPSWPFHSACLASIHQQNTHPLLTHTGIKHVNGSWLSGRIVLLLSFGSGSGIFGCCKALNQVNRSPL